MLAGPNAIGKTNVLEAIVLLALGKSFRTSRDEEMITFEEDFGRISLDSENESLEVALSRGFWQGKRVAKKRFIVNGVGKRRKDFIGRIRIVLFEPQDIEVVVGSPGRKREYLDFVLSQVDLEYDRCLLAYEKGLRQRNKLLSFIAEKKAAPSQLEFWNRLLVKNGGVLQQKREAYIEFLTTFCASSTFKELMGGAAKAVTFSFMYDPSAISFERLAKYKEAEIAAGRTLVGPHRDSFFIFQHNSAKKDLATYGSRGEQRMGVLALKLGELEFITKKTQERPLLLLDDVFSELDEEHQQMILHLVDKQQTIMTTTEVDAKWKKKLSDMEVIQLDNIQ